MNVVQLTGAKVEDPAANQMGLFLIQLTWHLGQEGIKT